MSVVKSKSKRSRENVLISHVSLSLVALGATADFFWLRPSFSRLVLKDPPVYIYHVEAFFFLRQSQEERLLAAHHFKQEEYGGMMRRLPGRLPLLDGCVIAHQKLNSFSYCLLLSSEGRLKHLLFQFHSVFLWVACKGFFSFLFLLCHVDAVQWVLEAYSNAAYQSPRGTEPVHAFQRFLMDRIE